MNKINFQDLPNETTPINANNLNQLQTNVDNAKMEKNSIKIPANSNLNDYKTEGFYYNNQNAEVATILNIPEEKAFSLLVERHAGIKQTFTTFSSSSFNIYVRNFYNGTWGDWVSILPVTVTNDNGTATKFPDGTMICTNRINIANVPITVAEGNIYRSGVLDEFPNFPAGFIDNPSLEISYLSSEDTKPAWAVKANAATTSAPRGFYLYSGASRTLTNAKVCYIAVGRWK